MATAIDALEEQVNEEAARVIALRAPIASRSADGPDRLKISATSNGAATTPRTWPSAPTVLIQMQPIEGASPPSLRRMAREVELMLKDALDAYIQRDAALALRRAQRDPMSTRCTTRCSASS
jgi:phosphate transport system protein